MNLNKNDSVDREKQVMAEGVAPDDILWWKNLIEKQRNKGRNVVTADDNWQAEMNFLKVFLPILAVLGVIVYFWVKF